MKNIIRLWMFLALCLFGEKLTAHDPRVKNINAESEFSLLLQNIRNRAGARDVISREDIKDSLLQLTGEILGEMPEAFVLKANQEILFEIVMLKMPELVSALYGGRDITSVDILKKFNEIEGKSVELAEQELKDLMLNFKACVLRDQKDKYGVAVLTERQVFMIAKDLVNNKIQNITDIVIKDRARAILGLEIVSPDLHALVEQVQNVYGQISMMYGFLRIDMLLQILQKTLKPTVLYADIEAAYYDMFGIRLKHVDQALISWFGSVVNDRYKQHVRSSLTEGDVSQIAASFLKGETVDYEDIQRQFLKQTKEKYLGQLLSLSAEEQQLVVDLVNEELAYKASSGEQLINLKIFLEKYSCTSAVMAEIKNSSKYVIKNGIDRIINAQRAKKCIEVHGWRHISIADKCLVCKKRDCAVIATRVDAQTVSVFSFDEVKELVAFAEVTGYQDWGVLIQKGYSANVLKDMKTEKLVFIDTEDKSFEVFFATSKYDCVELFFGSMQHLMTPEASKWVADRLKYLKDHDEEIVILPKNNMYDPEDVNFVKVKEEAAKLL